MLRKSFPMRSQWHDKLCPEVMMESKNLSKSYRCIFLLFSFWLISSQWAWAENYEEGRSAYISGDYKRAYGILKPLAEDGDSEAQKLLGIMYEHGHGVKANSKKALEWYIKSAKQGDPAVQYKVGAKDFRGNKAG